MDDATQEQVECPYCGYPMDPDITMHPDCLKSWRAEQQWNRHYMGQWKDDE